jgi:S-adenosylmethionine synthetase
MIRTSEMVLPGHPDKFCDQIADSIVGACQKADPDACCQVEVSVWSDQIWLSGSLVVEQKLPASLQEICLQVGLEIGYSPENWIDANKYRVTNTVCEQIEMQSAWAGKVNDQCIAIGYAGYDRLTHYLPPEHFLAHIFRLAITRSFREGLLAGQGPDGKFIIRMREEPAGWIVEHVLITVQQKGGLDFLTFCGMVEQTLKEAYDQQKLLDHRWLRNWEGIELQVNPNGPLVAAGSDGDNGQTGRKLVMDYYGPRVPIGGGALSGKDLAHIDRVASYGARDAAVRAVKSGAKECLVRLTYAPNHLEPIDIDYTMEGRGARQDVDFFRHDRTCFRYKQVPIDHIMAQGGHFFDAAYPWNGLAELAPAA